MKVYTETIFTTPEGKEKIGFYMDGYLKSNLDWLIKAVKNKWDGIFIISGGEGSGKSCISQCLGYYLDPSINIDRICFSGSQLMEAIDKAKKGQCIILDEAILTMATQDFASDIQQILIKKFTLIRSKQLFIILIIPNPFMLRRYFLVFRTKFMIHCYSPDGIKRGFAKFFSFKRKKEMYFLGLKTWNMNVVQPNYLFRFVDTLGWFISIEEYEAKKKEAVDKLTVDSQNTKDEAHKKQIADLKVKYSDEIARLKEANNHVDVAWKGKYIELREEYKKKIEALRLELKDSSSKRINTKLKDCEDDRDKLAAYVYDKEGLGFDALSDKLRMENLGLFTEKKLKDCVEHGKMLIEMYKRAKV